MYDAGAIATVQQVCEYLTWVENDLSLRPVLAESWTSDATGQVGPLSYAGVTFNNGKAFGADDVVATFKAHRPEVRVGRAFPLRGSFRRPASRSRRDHRALQLGSSVRRLPIPGRPTNYNT